MISIQDSDRGVSVNEGEGEDQVRLTGSKLETATTAPTMATSTTPPDTMLRRKFLSDGVRLPCAASATSGRTIAAAMAAAVSPAVALSFIDADALTAILAAAAGLALGTGWNEAHRGFLSQATDSGRAATADSDAVVAMEDEEEELAVLSWRESETRCKCVGDFGWRWRDEKVKSRMGGGGWPRPARHVGGGVRRG
ncbi:Os07g0673600 [Oryza sativa Japonica Group]|uniref:Os07g0673600 protein n=2 Tax=Oryza sativa subsp. japonica TaxID=39947 RepID=Q0D3Q0_ORYSJ|nr:Os07g0673600 [Oryza sativa Japonica Group]BAT03176.1 Os07g0673600 [Oryza sativa Japonica Group]|eukprot:NP_001060609.1 Os07g0673600 [Oryza sativa Japonica Group]